MFNLILAIISSALVSIVMRMSVKYVRNNMGMLSASYFSCMFLAAVNLMPVSFPKHGEGIGTAVVLGIIAGILFLAGFVLLQINVKRNGVVLSATFAKLGVLVPAFISVVFYSERMAVTQSIGFALALCAIILINSDKERGNAEFKTGLILLLLSNGLADAMAKIYEETGKSEWEDLYLIFTFMSAFIISMVIVMFKHEKMSIKDILFGFLLGIPNYYSVRFLMKALADIPAVITYPTYSVATIVVISFSGTLLFKETLNRKQKAAVGIIMISLVLLNIKI